MSKKTTETREQKTPATIKVSTVVKAVLVTIAVVASFVGGWNVKSLDQARIQGAAVSLNTQLK